MPKTQKPGWTYIYSEMLQQEIALNDKTGWVFCEDGTRYSPEELQLLYQKHGTVPLIVHMLKHDFKGELVKGDDNGKPGLAGTNKNKQRESSTNSCTDNSRNTGGTIPHDTRPLPEEQYPQLDIF